MTPDPEPRKLPDLPVDVAHDIAVPGKDPSTELSKHRTRLSEHRTDLSEHRTDLSSLRSHLSNERTHLSYLRTCVSLLGFGITLNRFSIYLQENKDLKDTPRFVLRDTEHVGAGLVFLGLALLVYALVRYMRVATAIETGKYEPRQRPMVVLTIVFILMGGVSAVWLFWLSGTH